MRERSSNGRSSAPKWVRFQPRSGEPPAMIIVCFPPAGGGGGSFAKLREVAAANAECVTVELPGRMSRLAEPPVQSMSALADHVAQSVLEAVEPRGIPYAFLGLCLGAVMAYETAVRVEAASGNGLRSIVAAGSNAPQKGPPSVDDPIDFLRRMGSPEDVFANPALLEMTLEILRSDLHLFHSYTCSGQRLKTPVSILYGRDDTLVERTAIAPWKDLATSISVDELPGGHFFLDQNYDRLLSRLHGDLLDTPR
ncbi:thioesterase II family protein [Micromonospora sp. NPDC006431]|uniref:thioesterase II family protein n=1 Tax=Micromonospora sp. NPDC006431 TaxID=3364235 RepID=UPI0036CFF7FA